MVVLVNNTIFTLKKTKLRDRADRLVLVAFYDIWPGNGGYIQRLVKNYLLIC